MLCDNRIDSSHFTYALSLASDHFWFLIHQQHETLPLYVCCFGYCYCEYVFSYFYLYCLLSLKQASAQEDWKPRTPEELKSARKICIERNKLRADLVQNLKKFIYTEEMKPYMMCFAEEIGILEAGAKEIKISRAAPQYKFDMPEQEASFIFIGCLHATYKSGGFDKYIIPYQNCIMNSAIGGKLRAQAAKKQ